MVSPKVHLDFIKSNYICNDNVIKNINKKIKKTIKSEKK